MRVTVFCSSSDRVSRMLLEEVELIGSALAESGHEVVYGGAHLGCMGALARGVIAHSGRLHGVVPEMDFMDNCVEPGLTTVERVTGLKERKMRMMDMADAFLVLPGGIGTLDELFEVLALKSLGRISAPVWVYDYLDCWREMKQMMVTLIEQGLVAGPLSEHMEFIGERSMLLERFK